MPTPPASPPPAETNPLAELVQRAIKAHPVLRDEKKLRVTVVGGIVQLEGSVFTRDSLRQLNDLMARIPGSESIRSTVDADVKAPQAREVSGKVPTASPGPSNVDRNYSIRHVRRPR